MTELAGLLTALGGFSEHQYLRFLASRLPSSLTEEDLPVSDLGLIDDFDLSDILAPLEAFRFPRSKHEQFHSYFDPVDMGLLFHPTESEQFVEIYLCSLYLYLNAGQDRTARLTPGVSGAIVDLVIRSDLETKAHVLKFLLWLTEGVDVREKGKSKCRPFYLLAACIIWASIMQSLSEMARDSSTEAETLRVTEERGILAHAEYDIKWRELMERFLAPEGEISQTVRSLMQTLGHRGYTRKKTEGGT